VAVRVNNKKEAMARWRQRFFMKIGFLLLLNYKKKVV
jgi:hypothetical protein